MSALIAVAALSARMLAEAARDGGYRVVALDLFGDADTRRASDAWIPLGAGATLSVDGAALLDGLRRLRARGAAGWVAGSGFEAQPELLAAGARILPLIGNPPEVVDRVRRPVDFFRRLAALGIPHPETRLDCPPSPLGWLQKDFASSGGRAVRPAFVRHGNAPPAERGDRAAPGIHYQRISPGVPMSALFVADGRRGRLIGVARQIVRRFGDRPYLFRGCVGPVPVAPNVRRALEDMLEAIAADFGLRGVNGLDFLLDDERVAVLELNPRPPASIALHRGALPGGVLRAHVVASLAGGLPRVPPTALSPHSVGASRCDPARPRGFEVVLAPRRCRVDAAQAAAFARLAWCHDLPSAGASFAPGDPVCTVSAAETTLAEVQARLARRRRRIPSLLEHLDERSSEGPRARQLECQ